ncbi:hypothetical protein Godav_029705, partial [Gossypium davidsonii]|nr:hypothetical protein [Gossypium davidsonii]
VEDVTTANTHEEINDYHGCEANVSLDEIEEEKKIFDASEQISSTSFIDAATLLGENTQTAGPEISRSIASEVLIQQKSEMIIQESDLELYLTLCEVEGLTEDELYRALSKIPNHPMQMLIFFSLATFFYTIRMGEKISF